ncbi:hypothetical protein LJC46_00045 [Desulfovibrio sp. OttesenSCG-928-G15]|nr:hypothetical protein [Desulfovibrio sp. OttesenSCG-928-G15]
MSVFSIQSGRGFSLGRAALAPLCLVVLLAAGCAAKSGKETVDLKKAERPGETELAYGMGLTLPQGWKVVNSLTASNASKQSLDTRRQGGERVLLLEATSPQSLEGMPSMIGIFLTSQKDSFMPEEYATKLKPEEFAAMSKDLLAREKADAKKKKTQSGLLDVQILRDDVGGKLAISQRMLVAGPQGKAIRLMNWDVYLPNGAGAAIKTVCDPQRASAESELNTVIHSMRFE